MAPPPPIGSNLAELDLADRARAGDQTALSELYRRHSGGLYRHAARMLRDDAAAKDVVQESFLRAIASMSQTRAELHFRAWVFRIATNLCLRELTQRSRAADEEVELRPADAELAGADREVLKQGRERAVEDALAALPERQRQILLLREVEELSYEELALVLELSLGNVKVSLHRARARFAAELAAQQLLANRSTFEGTTCEEGRALCQPSRKRELVRHLESCQRCRTGTGASLAELLALSPPLPLEPPAPPSLAAASSTAASAPGAAGIGLTSVAAGAAGVAGLGAGWVIALCLGALLVAGAAVGAALVLDRSGPDSRPRPAASSPASPPGSAARTERSPGSAADPGSLGASGESAVGSASTAPRGSRERRAGGAERRRRERAASSPRVVPQLGDTEDAP